MKKIKVGIVGYGNLGKALEELLYNDGRFALVCIFSKRDIIAKKTRVDKQENLHKYKNKIDILFLCGGSSSTLRKDCENALTNFCTIDAFDIHKEINSHIKKADKIAKQNSRVAFCSFGWDPGIFSYMRVLFAALNKKTYTSWGIGISQGHSEAIRKINGVYDAIQYTIPDKKIIKKIKNGKEINALSLHTRKCFVVCNKNNREEIKNKIINMPHYFKGYKTIVKFVSTKAIKQIKNLSHKGEVFTGGGEFGFYLKTQSNPHLTANIMIAFGELLYLFYKEKKFGAYSVLDIPMAKLIKNTQNYL